VFTLADASALGGTNGNLPERSHGSLQVAVQQDVGRVPENDQIARVAL